MTYEQMEGRIGELAKIVVELSETLGRAQAIIARTSVQAQPEPEEDILDLVRWGSDGGRNVD